MKETSNGQSRVDLEEPRGAILRAARGVVATSLCGVVHVLHAQGPEREPPRAFVVGHLRNLRSKKADFMEAGGRNEAEI